MRRLTEHEGTAGRRLVRPRSRLRPAPVEVLEPRLLFAGGPVPAGPALVSVAPQDRRVVLRDRLPDGTLAAAEAVVMRGVNWSPASAGTDPVNLTAEYANWYQIDLPKMAQAGVNVVRVYHDFGTGPAATAILDEFYRNGIKVIVTVDSPRHGVVADTGNISAVVTAYRNHPAVLMWAVGNEWDLNNAGNGFYFGSFPTLAASAAFVEQSARLIHSLDPAHPVATFMADPHIPAVHPLEPAIAPVLPAGAIYTKDLVTTVVPSVDVWGLNVYRGRSFGDVFRMWERASAEPMFIGEFGADSYSHLTGVADEAMQAAVDGGLWDELHFELSADRAAGPAAGGLVFEWQDEHWKNGSIAIQNPGTEPNGGQPDGFNDEEYFGLLRIDRTEKPALAAMRSRFVNGQSAVQLDARPTLRVVSQANALGNGGAQMFLGNKPVFSRTGGGGGGRGITVGVLDEHTGIRLRDIRTFDTWYSPAGFGGPHVHFAPFIAYLNALPAGATVLLAAGDEAGFINPGSGTPWAEPVVEQAYQAIEALGATQIRQVGYGGGWALIARKGSGALAEGRSAPGVEVSRQVQVDLTLDPDAGRRTTPGVLRVTVNDGSAQRSTVTALTVSFDRAVTLGAGAFALAGRQGAGVGTGVTLSNPGGDGRTWLLTFSGGPVIGSSLADGIYDLTVVAANVRAAAAAPAAAMAADSPFAFHRLFSDADGDGDSDNADLFQVRGTYNKPNTDPAFRPFFDYEGDGDVDNADLFQVRSRRTVTFKGY